MKLTKKLHSELVDIVGRLDTAIAWLERNDVLIGYKSDSANGLSYQNKQGQVVHELTKFVGSELMQLKNARQRLGRIINPPIVKEEHEQD